MSEGNPSASNGSSLRERLASSAEDRFGQALAEVLESPLLTGAIGRAFEVRERALQAQELAMGLLNLPSAADIERLTRRLRSVSQRLETIEDGLQRIERSLKGLEQRLIDAEDAGPDGKASTRRTSGAPKAGKAGKEA